MDETQGLLLNKGVARMAARVSGLGREVGVHLVLAVRNPNKDELGDDINTKRNMARVVFKVADGIMAAVATGRAKSGAEFLAGPGDALLLETEGGMVRLATAIAPPEAIASLPQAASLPRLPLDAPKDNDEARGTEPEKGHGGRKPEPMNAKALAYYLFHPRASQNQVQGFLRERTGHGINWERLPEHQEMAAEMRAEIEAKGWTFSAEGNRTEDG
jgi:DNA segregation ATPase FtsK/SpoIIIE-like protein